MGSISSFTIYDLSSYLISDGVIYLTIAEKSYPRKLAFLYLDELAREFSQSYGSKVDTARKPYAFVGFGESIPWFYSGILYSTAKL